jgi:hypothetical protein
LPTRGSTNATHDHINGETNVSGHKSKLRWAMLDENADDRCLNRIIRPIIIVHQPNWRATHAIWLREGVPSLPPVHTPNVEVEDDVVIWR